MERAVRNSPALALLLGMLVVGFGQVYNGRPLRGMVFLGAFLVYTPFVFFQFLSLDGVVIPLLLFLAIPLFYIYTLIDAFRGASGAPQGRHTGGWYLYATVAAVNVLLISALSGYVKGRVVEAYVIPGVSMEPTIMDNERLLVLKKGWGPAVPRRGDIVVFSAPGDGRREYIKRVVAVGGDTVAIRKGELYVNGRPFAGRHSGPGQGCCGGSRTVDYDTAPIRLAEDEVYVVGDNRDESYDSRHFGPVPLKSIKGRAVRIYYSRDPEKGMRWERLGKLL